MKFGDFTIGMPVIDKTDPDITGVIVEYTGHDDGIHYVNVELGNFVTEYALSELISAKGNC